MLTQVIKNTKGYIAGTGASNVVAPGVLVLPDKVNAGTNKSTEELFYSIDTKPSEDAPPPSKKRQTKNTNAEKVLSDSAQIFKGLLNSAPDIVNDIKNIGTSLLSSAIKTGIASSGFAAAFATGKGTPIGALLNLTTSSTNTASILTQQPNTQIISATQQLAAIFPNVTIPGMPGPTTSSSTSIQESLNGLSQLAGTGTSASETESLLSSDQLKKKAQQEFGKISALAKSKIAAGSLSGIVSKVQAAGGAASAAIPTVVAQSRIGGSALQKVLMTSDTGSALSGLMNMASETVTVLKPVTVDLGSIAPGVLSSATAQASGLIGTLPLSSDALSELSASSVASLKERLALESLSGSGLIKNTGAPITSSFNDMLVEYQGLSKTSIII